MNKRASNMVAAALAIAGAARWGHRALPGAIAVCVALVAGAAAFAGEPLFWERRPNRPAPAQFDTFHGETLDFRCAFTGFGELPFGDGVRGTEAANQDVRLWYQTNGMGTAWWSVPATVASNVVFAAWPPGADPGAERVSFFFGSPSNAYAAAMVRFRNSPGSAPNALEPPVRILDFATCAFTNAPWLTGPEVDARIAELSPHADLTPATNYTDRATNALGGTLRAEVAAASQAASNHVDLLANELSMGTLEVGQATYAAESGVAYALMDPDEGHYRSAPEIFAQLDAAASTNDLAAATNALDERYLSITGGYVRGSVEIDGSGTGRDALSVQGSIYGMGANFENVDIDYQLHVGEESRLHDTYIDGALTVNGEAVTPSDYATHEDLARFDWVVTNTVREIVFVNGYERLSLEANGTLGVETNGWPDGAGMMLELTPAGPYTVEGIRMLGYSAWPTSRADLVVWRSGTNMFANLVLVW